MKSIEDTLAVIDELIVAEDENLKDMLSDGDGDTQAAWIAREVRDRLRDLKEWILEQ